MSAIETALRVEWWNNHCCPRAGQYGDDGEMQCGQCGTDFKREPIGSLELFVSTRRRDAGILAYEAMKKPPEPARMPCPYCGIDHLDVGEWETRPHHKHLCLHCGKLFRFEGADGEYFYGVADPDHHP